jgi:ribosome-binding factor A
MSHRREQLASAIQNEIQDVIARKVSDPRISGLLTITSVRVTEDRTQAIVGVSVMPESAEKLTLHGLRAAAPFIRRELGMRIESRKLPELVFKVDRSPKREAALNEALSRVARERGAAGDAGTSPADSDAPEQDAPALDGTETDAPETDADTPEADRA